MENDKGEIKIEEIPLQDKKAEKKESKTFAYFIILLLIISLVFLIYHINNLNVQLSKKPVDKTIIQKVPDKQWYKEDCKCIEWKGDKTCLEGLKLNSSLGDLCYSQDGKTSSPSSTACSKYECEECFVSLKKGFAVKTTSITIMGDVSGGANSS